MDDMALSDKDAARPCCGGTLVTGLCVTGFIECCQLLVGRAFDIDGLLLNTLVTLCGFWLWRWLDRLLPKGLKRLHCKETESET